MTPELLASIYGIVLSLAFSYVPGLNTKYNALDGTTKRLVMLGVVVVVAAGAFGLTCAKIDVGGLSLTCDQAGAVQLIKVVIATLTGTQVAFLVSPRRKSA